MKESDQDSPITSVMDRLSVLANSAIVEDKWEQVLDELLLGLYPNLDPMELHLVKSIICTIWDIQNDDDNETLYNEVLLRTTRQCKDLLYQQLDEDVKALLDEDYKKAFFKDKKAFDKTLHKLRKKGIVSSNLYSIRQANGISTPTRYVGLPYDVVSEAIRAMGECLKSALDAHLKPM